MLHRLRPLFPKPQQKRPRKLLRLHKLLKLRPCRLPSPLSPNWLWLLHGNNTISPFSKLSLLFRLNQRHHKQHKRPLCLKLCLSNNLLNSRSPLSPRWLLSLHGNKKIKPLTKTRLLLPRKLRPLHPKL